MSHYFVTGATGAIGSAVVARLLTEPSTRLTLLIRASNESELESRLASLCRFWGRERSSIASQVVALAGDTTLPKFGLSESMFARLANSCTHLVHCAAIVRMNLPLEEARRSAVGAAHNVLALAQAASASGNPCKLDFVSTVGVAGRMAGNLPERLLTGVARQYHNTYEQAKSEAEDVIAAAMQNGSPTTVHRPSMVVGDSRSGRLVHFQVFYHLAEFLSGRRTGGVLPRLGAKDLDIVPVDYVAAAIAWSSRDPRTSGRVLHLCSGPSNSVRLEDLRQSVRSEFARAGIKLPPTIVLPRIAFRCMLPLLCAVAPAHLRRALQTLPVFLDYLRERQVFDNASTRELLAHAGIRLPSADEYVTRVITHYIEAQRLQA